MVELCYHIKGAVEETCVDENTLVAALALESLVYFIFFFGGWSILKAWLLRRRKMPTQVQWEPPSSSQSIESNKHERPPHS